MKNFLFVLIFSGWVHFGFSQCSNPNLFTTTFNINNSTPTTYTNKVVRLVLNTAGLVSTGKMAANGSDLRVGSSCCTWYPFWIDSSTMNTAATFIWVRMPSIAPSGSTQVKLFHGSPSTLSSLSNFSSTFPSAYILNSGSDSLLGPVTYDWFEVKTGATLYIRQSNQLDVTAEFIRINGTINGVGKGLVGPKTIGCTAGTGTGGGRTYSGCTNGGGGGYGGAGGCAPTSGASSCGGTASPTYGTASGIDITQGSSGASGSSASSSSNDGAGNGGGAVSLNAPIIIINGSINMNGQDGAASNSSSGGAGGGSGGGIMIQGNDLTFGASHSLTATGGRAGNSYGAGGGGGRIKIFRTGAITGTLNMVANGNNQHTYSGTVLLAAAAGLAGSTYSGTVTGGVIGALNTGTSGSPCGLLYYSKSTGPLNDTLSWGRNSDGSGANPPNFNTNGATYNVVNNGSPTITGNWIVSGSGTNVIFGDGTNAGNFVIPAGLTFGTDTFYLNNQMTATILGSIFTNRPGYDTGSTVQYASTNNQSITGGRYGNLVLAGSPKTLSGDVSVGGTLLLLNSVTTGSYTLTIGTGGTRPGTLNQVSGYVIGKLNRWIPTSATANNPGFFPVGTNSNYIPVQVDFTSFPAVAGTLSCEFINGPAGNGGFPLFDFTAVPIVTLNKTATNGVWRLIAGNGLSGGSYNITATANNFWGVSNVTDLRLVRRANSSSSWSIPGSSVVGTGTIYSAIVKRTGQSVHGGEFGVASDSTVNNLPVNLVYFEGKSNDPDAILNWATASEENSSHFVVERREEKGWVAAGKQISSGNSSITHSYQLTDKDVFASTNKVAVYRLKMVDKDGTFDYSPERTVYAHEILLESEPTLHPNPFRETLGIRFGSPVEGQVGVKLYDLNGKLVFEQNMNAVDGNSMVNIYPGSKIQSGLYLLELQYQGQKKFLKVVRD